MENYFVDNVSNVCELGYYPIPVSDSDKRPIRKGWPDIRIDISNVAGFKVWPEEKSLGILTGVANSEGYSVVAIDVDIKNEDKSVKIINAIKRKYGPAPTRVGLAPKALLVYAIKGENKKRSTKDSVDGKIEFLQKGQQFVAFGIHPRSGREYQWVHPLVSTESLSIITDEDIDDIIEMFYEMYPGSRPEKQKSESSTGGAYHGGSISDLTSDILNGSNLHDSLVLLSQQLAYDGMNQEGIIQMLRSLMNMSKAREDRPDEWMARYSDIPRVVAGVRVKESHDHRDDIREANDRLDMEEAEIRDVEVPWPPGLMGQLVQDCYDMSRYQYREVALVSAVGLIAGIAGRKYNVCGTGLNVYLTIIMGTGMGKDQIKEWVSRRLLECADTGVVTSSFIGPGRFTSYKSVINSLRDSRCQVSIITEAGLISQSAGDSASITKAILELYTSSGAGMMSSRESFSKKEDCVAPIVSPCLSIISESTDETLLKAFHSEGCGEKGDLPRQTIFRIDCDKPYRNENIKKALEAECNGKVRNLVKECAQIQSLDKYEVTNCDPTDEELLLEQNAFERLCTDNQNKFRDTYPFVSRMWSRAFMKAAKFAAIASVFNNDDAVITKQEWDWAVNLVLYDMNSVKSLFKGTAFVDNQLETLELIAMEAIARILKGGKSHTCDEFESERGIFTYSYFKQMVRKNKLVCQMDDNPAQRSNPKSGIDKCFGLPISSGYVIKLSDEENYKIREERRGLTKGNLRPYYGVTREFWTALCVISPDNSGGKFNGNRKFRPN